jgi:hypothetical protein
MWAKIRQRYILPFVFGFSFTCVLGTGLAAIIAACSWGEVKEHAKSIVRCTEPSIAPVVAQMAPLITQIIETQILGRVGDVDVGPVVLALSGLRADVESCIRDEAFAILERRAKESAAAFSLMSPESKPLPIDVVRDTYRRVCVVRYGGACFGTSDARQ